MTNRWPSRIATFSLWALAAGSAAFWLLKIIGISEAPVTAVAIAADTPAVDVQDLARALGPPATPGTTTATVAPPPPAQDPGARMRLLGVVAGRTSGGVALIAIDGQPARPYRVGSQIDTSHKLTRVATRSATLSPTQPDGQPITLELPSTSPEVGLRAGPGGGSVFAPGATPAAITTNNNRAAIPPGRAADDAAAKD